MRPAPRPFPLLALALALLLALAACSGGSSSQPTSPPAPVPVGGSVVVTAGSTNEMRPSVPPEVAAAWTRLADHGRGVELVTVGGDGQTSTTNQNLSGDGVARLGHELTVPQAEVPGRSALAGLNHLESAAGDPVWVFSPLLDTQAPLDFRQLAFDESPANAIKAVRKAGDLPDLKGRHVTFVVSPVAGEQKPLSKLQVGYQRAVWEGLADAAGAKRVSFFVGTGTTPGTGAGMVVPVPDPNDAVNAQHHGDVTTCTLPTPALFIADQPTLIDKKATLKALRGCLGDVTGATQITVEGHTAGTGASNAVAKQLSTQRATEVAALLKELGVPAKNITEVVGYGSSQPLVQPGTDPRNRAVVVTFRTPS